MCATQVESYPELALILTYACMDMSTIEHTHEVMSHVYRSGYRCARLTCYVTTIIQARGIHKLYILYARLYVEQNNVCPQNGPLQADFAFRINILQKQAKQVTNTTKYIEGARAWVSNTNEYIRRARYPVIKYSGSYCHLSGELPPRGAATPGPPAQRPPSSPRPT